MACLAQPLEMPPQTEPAREGPGTPVLTKSQKKRNARRKKKAATAPALPAVSPRSPTGPAERAAFEAAIAAAGELMNGVNENQPGEQQVASAMKALELARAGVHHPRTGGVLRTRRDVALTPAAAQVTGVLKVQGGDEGVMNALQAARAQATQDRLAAEKRKQLSAALRAKCTR
mmetsp:Transcript_1190/g.3574  ORF Transcript_1190/g.3574 Transcript_1190/m.3574 type:complete len:174 (+) Transcript_1190:143-664(+)